MTGTLLLADEGLTLRCEDEDPALGLGYGFPREETIDPDNDSITHTPVPETVERHAPTLGTARLEQLASSALAELERYSRYNRGWDGYRGEPFSPELLDRARRIVWAVSGLFAHAGLVPQEFTTGPASDGSLDVEIQTATKRLIMTLVPNRFEIEIYREDDAEMSEGVLAVAESPLLGRYLYWLLGTGVPEIQMD